MGDMQADKQADTLAIAARVLCYGWDTVGAVDGADKGVGGKVARRIELYLTRKIVLAVTQGVAAQHLVHHLPPEGVVILVGGEGHLDGGAVSEAALAEARLVDEELVIPHVRLVGRPTVVLPRTLVGILQQPRRHRRVVRRLLQVEPHLVVVKRGLQRLPQRGVEGFDELRGGMDAGNEGRRDILEPLHPVARLSRRCAEVVWTEDKLLRSALEDGARLRAADGEGDCEEVLAAEELLADLLDNLGENSPALGDALDIGVTQSTLVVSERVPAPRHLCLGFRV